MALFFPACGLLENREGKAVVIVGKRSLAPEQLKRDIKRLFAEMEITPEEWVRLRKDLVDRVVDHYLVLEYGREKGITVSEEEVESAVSEVRNDYGPSNFREILLKRCIDLEEWKEGLREQLLTQKIIKVVTEAVPAVTTEEIGSYFEEHAGEFNSPPMIRVRHVVSRTKAEAQWLSKRLANGEDMAELAGSHSTSPDGKRGGDMGWVGRGQLEEGIERVIFSLPVGQISPIVETPHGFHIFQVVSRRAGGPRLRPEVAAEIERRLSSVRAEAFLGKWLKGLRDRFPVVLNQDLLEKLEWA